jgi:hypothetical protein
VLAWGYNNYGQCTVPAGAQSGVTAIAAGWYHTVALKSDGSVLPWGRNTDGQSTVPAGAQSGVTAIAAGSGHTVALLRNKVLATVTLGSLTQVANGKPRYLTSSTAPAGLVVNYAYNGSDQAPTAVGPYPVTGTISSWAYTGSASGTLTVNPLQINTRETVDSDHDGYIDAIRFAANGPLNDNFAGLQISVNGYLLAASAYDTGTGANDGEFFVRLAEGGTPDTGATPGVQVIAGGSLGLPVDAEPVTPTDKAKPVLMSAVWGGGSGGGVSPNDPIYLTFSEPVTSNNALATDFGLPVSGDAFGADTTVSNGKNQQNSKLLTLTLLGVPCLTPGGVYSPGSLTAGSPTGIFVADGTRIVDDAGNAALVQASGTAVDLQPGDPAIISICWDNLSIAPRNWNIGLSDGGATYQACGYFPPNGLVARNNGNVREKFTMSCSTASPAGWTVATTAGQNQFELKADNGAPPWLDLATGPKDIATQLYSGHDQAFDLQFKTPTTGTTGAGVGQTINVTITAAKD